MGKFYLKKAALAAVVALFALGGANEAYAQTTTLYERALTGDNAWTTKGITDWTAGADNKGITTSTTAADGFLFSHEAKATDVYEFSTPITVSATNSTLDLTATIKTGAAYSSYWSLKIGDVEFAYSDNQGAYIQIGGTKTTLAPDQKKDMRGQDVGLTISINQGTKAVSYTVDWASSTDAAGTGVTATTDFSKITISKTSSTWSWATTGSLKAIKLTETASTATYANYAVTFVDANGNTLKTETRTGEVGATIAANEVDKATWYSDDKTKKYVYASETSSGNVTADNTGTLTITYNAYGQYTATLTSVYGDNSTTSSVTKYDDETETVYYPAYVKDEDGVYYGIVANEEAPSFGVTFSKDNTAKTITYTKDESVVYFAEYEDLGGKYFNSVYSPELSSSGSSRFLSSSTVKTAMATTEDGNYEVTVRGGNRDGGHTTNLKVYLASDTENAVYTSGSIKASSDPADYTFDISIKAGDELYFQSTSGNDRFAGDYVLVKKIDAPTVTINATSKLASYSNASAVTVPSGVVIYKAATPADGSVVLTKVEGSVIPANTGVILYSETTGKRELTYGGTSTGDFTDNALKATGNSTVAAGDNYYALVAGQQAIAKVKSGVEIPANKAYLEYTAPTTTETEAKLSVVFDGTVTAIESVTTNDTNGTNAIYNLSGQRVSKSYKGVVVKNGKKYINK